MSISRCLICGSEMAESCSACLISFSTCIVCYGELDQEQHILQCTECKYMGHYDHLFQWLKHHAFCPVCLSPGTDDLYRELAFNPKMPAKVIASKTSIFSKRQTVFRELSFHLPYYQFQSSLRHLIIRAFQQYESFLLVSPPGSGKTIVSLSVIDAMECHTLVVVPNLAVMGSWFDRLELFFDPGVSKLKATEIIGKLTGALKPISVATYDEIRILVGKPIQTRSERILQRLKNQQIGMLVLDECHHLTGQMARDLQYLAKEIGAPKILGLTATPPIGSNYDSAMGLIFNDPQSMVEIPLPKLVRDRILVPYRDLAVPLPSLEYLSLLFQQRHPGLSIKNQVVPDSRLPIEDQLILRWFQEWDLLQQLQSDHLISKLPSKKLRDLHWLASKNSIRLFTCLRILKAEIAFLRDKFRGMIFLDQETLPKNYSLPLKGINGAMGVLRACVSDPEIDLLNPVLVTGRSLVVDDDYADLFVETAAKWSKERDLEFMLSSRQFGDQPYAVISGIGKDYTIDHYSRFVSYVFERGDTKLLIGTKYLHGEGWDSQSLNTIIDLTTNTSTSLVIQVKGRVLRRDPEFGKKSSNIWEIAPSYLQNILMRQAYHKWVRRFDHYYGIDAGMKIRNGVHRMHPIFGDEGIEPHNFGLVWFDVIEQARKRELSFELWQVGTSLGKLYASVRISITWMDHENLIGDHDITEAIGFILSTIGKSKAQMFKGEWFYDLSSISKFRTTLSFYTDLGTNVDHINALKKALQATSTTYLGVQVTFPGDPVLVKWIKTLLGRKAIETKYIVFIVQVPHRYYHLTDMDNVNRKYLEIKEMSPNIHVIHYEEKFRGLWPNSEFIELSPYEIIQDKEYKSREENQSLR